MTKLLHQLSLSEALSACAALLGDLTGTSARLPYTLHPWSSHAWNCKFACKRVPEHAGMQHKSKACLHTLLNPLSSPAENASAPGQCLGCSAPISEARLQNSLSNKIVIVCVAVFRQHAYPIVNRANHSLGLSTRPLGLYTRLQSKIQFTLWIATWNLNCKLVRRSRASSAWSHHTGQGLQLGSSQF